jgi:lactate permease
MILLVQVAPLAAIVALLASGRADPLRAVVVALVLAVPAAAVSVPPGTALAPLLAEEAARGAFLALQPIAVTLAGLVFHGAVSARPRENEGDGVATHARLFTVCLLLGPFFETVTGFGVGAVFALGDLHALGVFGPAGAALSLFSQVLIPWGGLGPGTLLGAALAGVPLRALGAWNAVLSAAWLLALLPVFWRLAAEAGLPPSRRDRLEGAATLLVFGALLIAANLLATVEVAGLLALGPPLLWQVRHRIARPGAARTAAPYLALSAVLLASRLVPGAAAALTSVAVLQPWPDLPGFALLHQPGMLLGAVGLGVLATVAGHRRAILRTALARGARPAALMLGYVVLARLLGGSGAAAALARALAASAGPALPFVVPLLGAAGGFFAATNVGSNSILMPIQSAMPLPLPPAFVAAVQNFTGSAFCVVAPMRLGATAALAADGTAPGAIGRRLWATGAAAVAVAWVAIAALVAAGAPGNGPA